MAASDKFAYIEGLAEIQRHLRPPDELLAAPWKRAMTELADAGARAAVAAAPIGSKSSPSHVVTRGPNKGKRVAAHQAGLLRARIKMGVQKGAFPKWAKVKSTARRGRYNYPRRLEFDAAMGHLGWFGRSVYPRLIGASNTVLTDAANAIARKWGS